MKKTIIFLGLLSLTTFSQDLESLTLNNLSDLRLKIKDNVYFEKGEYKKAVSTNTKCRIILNKKVDVASMIKAGKTLRVNKIITDYYSSYTVMGFEFLDSRNIRLLSCNLPKRSGPGNVTLKKLRAFLGGGVIPLVKHEYEVID